MITVNEYQNMIVRRTTIANEVYFYKFTVFSEYGSIVYIPTHSKFNYDTGICGNCDRTLAGCRCVYPERKKVIIKVIGSNGEKIVHIPLRRHQSSERWMHMIAYGHPFSIRDKKIYEIGEKDNYVALCMPVDADEKMTNVAVVINSHLIIPLTKMSKIAHAYGKTVDEVVHTYRHPL